jgi:recombinational DNA repair protein (RecF pathway)
MRGFVLSTTRVRDEDLIVKILTKDEVLTLYRFYGARHSYINVGNLIDFVVEESAKSTIKRLRNVVQLPFGFMYDLDKMLNYKLFVSLLNKHLFDVTKIDPFYYNWLYDITQMLDKRDAKRLFVESYVKLLKKEGRLHNDFVCFICERVVEDKIALARAFLPAHEKCIMSDGFDKEKIKLLFDEEKSLLLSDDEINRLWKIINLGF